MDHRNKDLRWHHGNENPFTFYVHIEDGKKFHPIQKEEKELVKLESSFFENHKAGRQTGEGESRDIKRKKNARRWGTPVSLKLVAKILLNWTVLEVNYLLTDWSIAITVQWTLEEEWNPGCMLVLFCVLAKYSPNGLILSCQERKVGFNSPWYSAFLSPEMMRMGRTEL